MSWWAVGASIAIAVPVAAAAANTALHWRRFRPAPTVGTAPGPRRAAGAKLSARALIDEAAATLLVFLAPLAALWPARRAGALIHQRPAVAVLHDPLSGAAAWLLLRRLRAAGWTTAARMTAAPALDDEGVDALADSLSRVLDDKAGDDPVALLGLGAGGLAARQIAARHARYARVVTLATPHQGSDSIAAPATLRPAAARVAAVARTDGQPRRFDAIAVYSDGDAWIEPQHAAYYPGAFNLEVHDVGHLSTFFSRRVFAYVAENLGAPLPAETAPPPQRRAT